MSEVLVAADLNSSFTGMLARAVPAKVAGRFFDAAGRPVISDAGLAMLKWIGLVLMTLDHVNKYLLHSQVEWMFAAGRTVMPVFSFVLAYNLARAQVQPGGTASGAAARAAKRLLAFGLLATPVSWALMGPWPLNILFMLATSAWMIHLLQRRKSWWAALVGLVCGVFVEFWWPAIGATVAAWYFCRAGSGRAAAAWILALWFLTAINGNLWALVAVAVIALCACVEGKSKRLSAIFYWYYPLHLAAILALFRLATP